MPGQTDVLWFLPTHGDGRYLGSTEGARECSLPYLKQIAQAADQLGYFGVLLPTGRSCEDSWIVASALAPLTERLRFLVAVRPGLQEPAVAARMAATLDRVSNGRLLINVVTGGDPVELKGDGVFLDHAERYAVTDEFLHIWRGLLAGETVTFRGSTCAIEDGKLFFPAVQRPYPPLFFGGSSDAGMAVAAEHVDVYLTWGEPPADVAEKIAAARNAAAARGRTLCASASASTSSCAKGGGRLARRRRPDLASSATPRSRRPRRPSRGSIPSARAAWRASMAAAGTTSSSPRTCGPASAWCAAAPARRSSATRTRSPSACASTSTVGIEHFILSGYPHLEECYRFAELVMPKLPLSEHHGRRPGVTRNAGPFGEMIANEIARRRRPSPLRRVAAAG